MLGTLPTVREQDTVPPAADKITKGNDDSIPDAKRNDMRKAGEAYFERMLQSGSRRPVATRKRDEEDPDMLAVGSAIEGSKIYIVCLIHVLSKSLGICALKESMEHLETPTLLLFCHQLPLLACIWVLAQQGFLDLTALSATHKPSAVPSAILTSCNLICFFACLNHGSVYLVIAYTVVCTAALEALVPVFLGLASAKLSDNSMIALAVASIGVVINYFRLERQGYLTWVMLALWTLTQTASTAWECIKQTPAAAGRLVGEQHGPLVAEVASRAGHTPPVVTSFVSHSLSALPVLILAFGFQEGNELVHHDVSVPSLSLMLSSAVFFAAAEASRLFVTPSLSAAQLRYLQAATIAGITIAFRGTNPLHAPDTAVLGMIIVGAGVYTFRTILDSEI